MKQTKWTPEEEAYIRTHWEEMRDTEIADQLGRTPGAVATARRRMRLGNKRTWTPEEEEYIADKWGTISIPGIAKHLGRSVNAIKVRAARLGLGAVLMGGEYVTLNQLLIAATGTNSAYSYKMTSWVEKRGLPVHTKRVEKNSFRVVYLDEFWEWAEKNRSFLDFSKMQPLALGEEPPWVAEQRRKDYQAFANQRKDPWTPSEDSRLVMLLQQHRYGYAELSEMLHRSAGAIQRRCNDLGIKERPVKADNHSKESEWTEADFQALADGIRRGDSYTAIGRAVGRSEKAVRGKVYFVYLTERADKIRAMMGDGPWGSGAPEPTVKQAVHLSRTRTAVRKDLAALAGLLAYHRNELGYEPFWQRHMCMKWHPIKGCTADCADCDSCTEFRRIRPQYCVRCGGTFFEREESRICAPCRAARRWQARKKWAVTHKRNAIEEE